MITYISRPLTRIVFGLTNTTLVPGSLPCLLPRDCTVPFLLRHSPLLLRSLSMPHTLSGLSHCTICKGAGWSVGLYAAVWEGPADNYTVLAHWDLVTLQAAIPGKLHSSLARHLFFNRMARCGFFFLIGFCAQLLAPVHCHRPCSAPRITAARRQDQVTKVQAPTVTTTAMRRLL